MSKNIKTPTNVKLLTNVAVVRAKKNGKRFEIACYKNKVLNWRNKTEKDIDEVLQTPMVFTNVSKGQLAKKDELIAAYGTDDQLDICKQILEKGDLQVSEKERQAASDQSLKEVSQLIASMVVNPETKRPIPPNVIDKALQDIHFSLKANRSTKQQALEAIPRLQESMKIERAKMRIRISMPSKQAKMHQLKLKSLFSTVEIEDWAEDGLELVGLIEPGQFRAVDEYVRNDSHGTARLEILSLKDVVEGEFEISMVFSDSSYKCIRPFNCKSLDDPILSTRALDTFRALASFEDDDYLSYLLHIHQNIEFTLRNSTFKSKYVQDLLIELQGLLYKGEQNDVAEELTALTKQIFFKCSADLLLSCMTDESELICILSSLSYYSVDCVVFEKSDLAAFSATLALDSLALVLHTFQETHCNAWNDNELGSCIVKAILPNEGEICRLHSTIFQEARECSESLLPTKVAELPETFADHLYPYLEQEFILKTLIMVMRRVSSSATDCCFSLFRLFHHFVRKLKTVSSGEEFTRFDSSFFTSADFALFLEWLRQWSEVTQNNIKLASKISFTKEQVLHWKSTITYIKVQSNISPEDRLRVATVIRTVRLDKPYRNVRILYNIFKFTRENEFPSKWRNAYAFLILKNLQNIEYTDYCKKHIFHVKESSNTAISVDEEEAICHDIEDALKPKPTPEENTEMKSDSLSTNEETENSPSKISCNKNSSCLTEPKASPPDSVQNNGSSIREEDNEPVEQSLLESDIDEEEYLLNMIQQTLNSTKQIYDTAEESFQQLYDTAEDNFTNGSARLLPNIEQLSSNSSQVSQPKNNPLQEKMAAHNDNDGMLSFLNQQLKLNTAQEAEQVATTIENAPYVKILELKGNTLGIEAGRRISTALEKHPELERCLWSDLFTGRLKNEIPPVLRCLTNALVNANCNITELDLSDNAFGPIGAEGIQDFLVSRSAYSLEVLKLNNNGLGAGGKIIAECLLRCHANARRDGKEFKLKTFIAGRNRLENPGAIALAEAFSVIRTLETIQIPQNGIRPEGIIALAGSFENNANLRSIVLNDNTCDSTGAGRVAKSLTNLVQLEVLDLGDCLCRSAGCNAVIAAICDGRHRKIKTVDLSGSELSGAQAKNIIKMWKIHFDLNGRLLLSHNMFGGLFEEIKAYAEDAGLDISLGNISDDEGSESEKYSSSDSSDLEDNSKLDDIPDSETLFQRLQIDDKRNANNSGVLSFLNQQLKLNTAQEAEQVATTIENAPYVKILELKGNTLGIEAGRRISTALEKHPELERCLWSDLFTGRLKNEIPPVLRCLTNALVNANCNITELDLSDNAFGPIGAEGIQDFLVSRSAYSLEVLKLNNNGLGAGGKIIAECLLRCHANARRDGKEFKLKTFIAGRNRLENPGAIALAEAFSVIRTLETIQIPQNGIRPEGIIALAGSFENNPNLKTIVLNDNTCDSNGAYHIAKSLPTLVQLEVLDLGDCLCRSGGCGAVIAQICDGRHHNIQMVDLSGSELPGKRAKLIIKSWEQSFSETNAYLKLSNNMFGSMFVELEERIKKRNLKVELGDFEDDEGSSDEMNSDDSADEGDSD